MQNFTFKVSSFRIHVMIYSSSWWLF